MKTKLKRPLSSHPLRKKIISKKKLLITSLNENNYTSSTINNITNTTNINKTQMDRPKTSFKQINLKNIFSKASDNKLDVINLIIETNPNQYNYKKVNQKIKTINPLFKRGTEQNLKRPLYSKNTEEVYYKYNLLYGNNSSNLIRTYSPKMRPMSASIHGFNKKMAQDLIQSVYVFNDIEIIELIRAKCKDIGIDLRENMISKFKDFCNSKCKNRVVDLSENYIGIYSIKLISKILYNSDRIARLNLTRNNLGDQGVEILVNSIKNSKSLISLNITSNSITYKGGEIIFSQLQNQQSIIDLNISSKEGINRNRLTSKGIKDIEDFMKLNIFIEKFNICGNGIKDEGFILLSKGLNENNNLLNLNISNNDIHIKGFIQGLNMISNCKLYSLNISNNPILDDGLKKLTDSLKNFQNLHKLNISNCDFGYPGFEYLINALQTIKRIEHLNVSKNYLYSKQFGKIKPCFSTFGIKYLNMSKCSLGNESTFHLGEGLINNETIVSLNISGNTIGDLGFRSFIPLFTKNNIMESFDCSMNLISDVTAKDFIKNMKYNRTLKKVNLFDNQLTDEMGNIFIEILEMNKSLVNVNLMYNRVQIKTIEDINKLLKANADNKKARFIPDLQKDIKLLQFNPEMFKYYTKNILNKKEQQKSLYKKVRQDDRSFSRLIIKENHKVDLKIQEKESMEREIKKYQVKIKEIKDKLDQMESETKTYEDEINKKVDEEIKILKKFKDKNDMLKAEYNATKKDLDLVMEETKEKQKISLEKLNMAKKSVDFIKKELIRKGELLKNLNNPAMLVPSKVDENKIKKPKYGRRRSVNYISYNNLNTDQNLTKIASANIGNIVTMTSGNVDIKRKDTVKRTMRLPSSKPK